MPPPSGGMGRKAVLWMEGRMGSNLLTFLLNLVHSATQNMIPHYDNYAAAIYFSYTTPLQH
jgi:hypothetical protein